MRIASISGSLNRSTPQDGILPNSTRTEPPIDRNRLTGANSPDLALLGQADWSVPCGGLTSTCGFLYRPQPCPSSKQRSHPPLRGDHSGTAPTGGHTWTGSASRLTNTAILCSRVDATRTLAAMREVEYRSSGVPLEEYELAREDHRRQKRSEEISESVRLQVDDDIAKCQADEARAERREADAVVQEGRPRDHAVACPALLRPHYGDGGALHVRRPALRRIVWQAMLRVRARSANNRGLQTHRAARRVTRESRTPASAATPEAVTSRP